MLKQLRQTKIQILIIIFSTFLVYSNIFQNQFVLDDEIYIVSWPFVQNLSHIPEIFSGASPAPAHRGVYRPVSSIISAVYHQLWGTNTLGYHGAAIFFHILATVLVYFITRQLILRTTYLGGEKNAITPVCLSADRQDRQGRPPRWTLGFTGEYLPFITALLFGLHPIHTEAVAFMTASTGGLPAVVFFFASFYLYINHKRRPLLWLASLLLALLAFFAYELTLVLPLLLVIYEIYFGNGHLWKANFKKWLPYFVLAIFYVLVRAQMLGIDNFDNRYTWESFYFVQLLMVKVHALYLFLLFLPISLSIDHIIPPGYESYRTAINNAKILTDQSFLDLEIIVSIALLAGLIILAWKTYRKHPLLSFGISWFFICLLPVANFLRLPTVFAERYIYLGSFGFILSISLVFSKFIKNQKMWFYSFIFIIIAFGARTYLRNFDWYDKFSIWTQAAIVYPKSVLPYYSLGNQQYDKGFQEDAIKLYLKALGNQPGFYPARFSLGYTYQQTGKFELMEREYRKVIETNPDFLDTYINLSDYYISEKREDDALKILKQAAIIPFNQKNETEKSDLGILSKIYYNLGSIYQMRNQTIPAYINIQKALQLSPGNGEIKKSLQSLVPDGISIQQLIQGSDWKNYQLSGVSFLYPQIWKTKREGNSVILSSGDNYFQITLEISHQPENFSANNFITGQKESLGKLGKEGYIKLGNFGQVFVRQWNDQGNLRAQVFIFDSEKIVKILIDPAEPEFKEVLDHILDSLKIQ